MQEIRLQTTFIMHSMLARIGNYPVDIRVLSFPKMPKLNKIGKILGDCRPPQSKLTPRNIGFRAFFIG